MNRTNLTIGILGLALELLVVLAVFILPAIIPLIIAHWSLILLGIVVILFNGMLLVLIFNGVFSESDERGGRK